MDFFEVIERRRSIRKFKPNPIPKEDLKKILDAGRLAPSGGNRQPWQFIVVKDLKTKKDLAAAANNQMFIADADTVVVGWETRGNLGNFHTSFQQPVYLTDKIQ